MATQLKKMDQENENMFWNLLEGARKVSLPVHIKNILKLNNLDNPFSFQGINEDTFNELETFAREIMKEVLDDTEDLKLFYGIFHKMPEKFKFSVGDRLLILSLVKFVKEQNENFWNSSSAAPLRTNSQTKPTPLGAKVPPNAITRDMNSEQRELLQALKTALKGMNTKKTAPNDKDDDDTSLKDTEGELVPPVTAEDFNIQLSVKEMYDDLHLPISFTYSAKVDCYICKKTLTLTKIAPKTEGAKTVKARWVISNYPRHIRQHFENLKEQKPGRKRKNQSVLKMLTVSPKVMKLTEAPSAVSSPATVSSCITLASTSGGQLQISAEVHAPDGPELTEANMLTPIFSGIF